MHFVAFGVLPPDARPDRRRSSGKCGDQTQGAVAGPQNVPGADARNNFASLRPVTPEWLAGLQLLVKGVKIDLNAKLNPDDA
jgi:hypothetical protein